MMTSLAVEKKCLLSIKANKNVKILLIIIYDTIISQKSCKKNYNLILLEATYLVENYIKFYILNNF